MRKIAVFFSCLLVVACAGGAEQFALSIGDAEFSVEVVDTPETRATGLMYREELPESDGMLFVFEDEEPRAFYMKNTLIPLSIAYIDSSRVIREIYDMEPLDETPIPSRYPAAYALEVNQGAFDRAGVRVGQRIIFSPALAERVESVR